MKIILIGFMLLQTIYVQGQQALIDKAATKETKQLAEKLKQISSVGFLFGHQSSTTYGHAWSGIPDKSDVKDVCGDYPAVLGLDFADVTSLIADGDSFGIVKAEQKLVAQIQDFNNKGGVISFCWHLHNPVSNGSFYWEKSPVEAVGNIIPGGNKHDSYKHILNLVAQVANNSKDKNGKLIPLLFRPFHEFDGDWFWWGKGHTSYADFVSLWQFTVSYLRDSLNVHNFIYAYSPDCRFDSDKSYLSCYPGNNYVDLLGVDDYWDFNPKGNNNPELVANKLNIVSTLAKEKHKLAALTETGLESIPDSLWWTSTLLPTLKKSKAQLCYVLVWRNANDIPTHFYAPFPGQASVPDFIRFYKDSSTFFLSDFKNFKIRKEKRALHDKK
jgi:mannan endo-1,4-beta-mannosidase